MSDSIDFDEPTLAAMLDIAKARSRAMAQRNRWRSVILSVAMACSLAVAGTVVLIARAPGHMPQQSATIRPKVHSAVGDQWRLVSDVTSGTWQASSLESSGKVLDLECPATTTCYFIDNTGNEPAGGVEVTHDGGETWQQSSVPTDDSFFAIGCADANDCMVAGSSANSQLQFFATSDGGRSWSATENPDVPATVELGGISCPAVGHCIVVGRNVLNESVVNSAETDYAIATTDGGQSWTVSQMPSGFVTTSIDCPTADNCVASGTTQQASDSSHGSPAAIAYSSDGGSTWALATLPVGTGSSGILPGTTDSSGSQLVASISCSDATNCVAVAVGKIATTGLADEVLQTSDGGATWTKEPATGLPPTFTRRLSCPSSTDCWVAGFSSAGKSGGKAFGAGLQGILAMTGDGGQAFQVSQLPQGVNGPVMAVSCPSVTTCYALAVDFPQLVNPLPWAGAKSGGGGLAPNKASKTFQQTLSQPGTLVLLTYSAASGA